MVSMKGAGVGTLGDYLNNCVMPPAAPCGGTVKIGMLGAMLNDEGSSNVMSNSSLGTPSPTSPSVTPQAFTGEAGSLLGSGGIIMWISALAASLTLI
jgi:hypothetical protein